MNIAIVHPSGHFFNTPCVPNLAKSLAEKGIKVDVYAVCNLAAPVGNLEHEKIFIKYFPIKQTKSKENIIGLLIGFFFWFGNSLRKRRYDYIIATGIRALFLVGFLSIIFRFKYIYNSLEIYSGPKYNFLIGRIFKRLESYFNRRAEFSLIQDEIRAEILRKVNFLGNQSILIFPNSPFLDFNQKICRKIKPSLISYEVNKRFGIREEKKILIFSGSLLDNWMGLEKILTVIKQFSEDWILFLQSRMDIDVLIPKKFNCLISSRKVIFSPKPLSNAEYNELISGIGVGLAWYESEKDNIKYVGLSSGKISQYLFHGKPIIVNRIPMYPKIFNKYKCGIIVDRVEEIPWALNEISNDYESFSLGAYKAYQELFDLTLYTEVIVEFLKKCSK